MENLHRDPNPARRDYNAFISELVQFHKNRGTPFRHVPRINGREVDLYALYNQVTALGGWQKVNDQQKWDIVSEQLGLWSGCVNSALALRQIYVRYLGLYEKLHFLGEDIDDDSDQNPDSRSRKQQFCTQQMLPLSYNYSQHDVTDLQRTGAGLSRTFVTASDYDKLCLSLLSGLPNEQEFVLNVCTILSNEGKHVLHLERTPRLLDLLVAQTGVWPENDPSLRTMYLENWESLEGKNMEKFWKDTLDSEDPDIMELWGQEAGCRSSLNEDDLFNLGQELGVRNAEGQNIMRVALILHNLSFEEHNVPVLVSNSSCLRFLLLCAHCKWANLRQVALITLSNLAGQLALHPDRDLNSRLVLRMVTEGVSSLDRFLVLRSLEILAQLCQHENNEDVLARGLDLKFYHKLIELLTVHDIMLLIYTLEALYSLSDLGRSTCEKIVKVNKSIATLISLLTLEPDSLGPEAHRGFKVVESFDTVSHSQGASHVSGLEVDSETYACNWLRATYEYVPGHTVVRSDIYAEYVTMCCKMGRKGVLSANVFANCVKSVFPQTVIKRVEGSSNIIFNHEGLRRKPAPLPMAPPSSPSAPKAVPGSLHTQQGGLAATSGLGPPRTSSPLPNSSHPNHSPILKAQLSAPPRPMPPPPAPRTPLHQNVSPSPSPPSSPQLASGRATPPGSGAGSSTLIKTLLASKVTKNIQRQQQMHESIPHSQAASRVTNTRPSVVKSVGTMGAKHQNSAPGKVTSPLQNAIKSKAKSSFAPILPRPNRIIKDNPTPPPPPSKLQKAAKARTVPCSPNARLNGTQRDVQLDVKKVCAQVGEAKNSLSPAPPNSQAICIPNHTKDEGVVVDTEDSSGNHAATVPVSVAESAPRSDGEQSTSSRDTGFSSESDQNLSPVSQKDLQTKPQVGQLVGVIRAAPKSQGLNNNAPVQVKQQQPVQNQQVPLVNTTVATITVATNSISPVVSSSSVQALPRSTSPSQVLKSVLSELKETPTEEQRKWIDKEKVYKSSPLLNGLLDKGRIPLLNEKEDTSNSMKNGSVAGTTPAESKEEATKEPSAISNVQLPDAVPKNESVVEQNSVAPQPAVVSVAVSISKAATLTNGQSSQQVAEPPRTDATSPAPQPSLPKSDILLEAMRKSDLLLEMEQENSNQNSDLSSISDIARTVETASKAISRTNAECHSQVPFNTTTIQPGTPCTIVRIISQPAAAGQLPTASIIQPQVPQQNVRLMYISTPINTDDSGELIGFPRVSISQLNQIRQHVEQANPRFATPKRPSTAVSPQTLEAKRLRMESKTPLLEASLRSPVIVPTPVQSPSPVTTSTTVEEAATRQPAVVSLPSSTVTKMCVTAAPVIERTPTTTELRTYTNNRLTQASTSSSSSTSTQTTTPSVKAPVESQPSSASTSSVPEKPSLEYVCEWKDCLRSFKTPMAVFVHASAVHAPEGTTDLLCQWDNCDGMKRKRLSLLTHLQDRHCNDQILQLQALRKSQISQFGKTSIPPPQPPPPHPGYAPDAALLAIRRHAIQFVSPKELAEKETPLAKSIHLTTALIIRNLATYSPLARGYLRRYEPELICLAMSNVESSRTLAQCLAEMSAPAD